MRTAASTYRCSSSRSSSWRPTAPSCSSCVSAPSAVRFPIALYTADMFETGNDADNRAALRAVATADLDLVGLALRAPHRDADALLRGLKRHP